MKGLCLVVALPLLIAIGCDRNQTTMDASYLAGAWYLIRNGSLYEEVIFTDSSLWSYNSNAGELEFQYRIDGDSLVFISSNTNFAQKFTKIGPDEFLLENKHASSRYHRLGIDVNLEGIKQGNVMELDEYVAGFNERKQKWIDQN